MPETASKYNHVVKSGLLKVLDLVKTSPESTVVDEISLLQAIKVTHPLSNYRLMLSNSKDLQMMTMLLV